MRQAAAQLRHLLWILPLVAILSGTIIIFADACNFFNTSVPAVTSMSVLVGVGLPIAFFAGRRHENLVGPLFALNPENSHE